MPAVCRFYIKGYCRYGRNCRFEHPGESDYAQENSSYATTTSFSFKAALNEPGGSTSFSPINFTRPQSTFSSYQQPSFGCPSGFSFTRALETIKSNPVSVDDVDMSADVTSNSTTNFFNTSYQGDTIGSAPFGVPRHSQFQSTLSTFGFDRAQSAVRETNPNFSRLTDLDEAERKAYEKSVFEFRSIPLKPPPQELCQ